MIAQEIQTFVPDKPHLWTNTRLAVVGVRGATDLSPDGEHVVGVLPAESPDQKADSRINLFFNFFDEGRRRAPRSK